MYHRDRASARHATAAPAGNAPAGDADDVAYDENVVSEVIRPAAIVPEEAARAILVELSLNSVHSGGVWRAEPSRWNRYDKAWVSTDDPGESCLLGSIQVAYGTPTKYEITIYRVSISRRSYGAKVTVSKQSDPEISG